MVKSAENNFLSDTASEIYSQTTTEVKSGTYYFETTHGKLTTQTTAKKNSTNFKLR